MRVPRCVYAHAPSYRVRVRHRQPFWSRRVHLTSMHTVFLGKNWDELDDRPREDTADRYSRPHQRVQQWYESQLF